MTFDEERLTELEANIKDMRFNCGKALENVVKANEVMVEQIERLEEKVENVWTLVKALNESMRETEAKVEILQRKASNMADFLEARMQLPEDIKINWDFAGNLLKNERPLAETD